MELFDHVCPKCHYRHKFRGVMDARKRKVFDMTFFRAIEIFDGCQQCRPEKTPEAIAKWDEWYESMKREGKIVVAKISKERWAEMCGTVDTK
jgi:hypothetical protein